MLRKLKRRGYRFARNAFLDQIYFRIGATAAQAQRGARGSFLDLWDAEFRVFSQWGEDGILNYLLDTYSLPRPRVVEFGAGNFTECNSRFLVEYRNASAFVVDGRSDLISTVEGMDLRWRSTVIPRHEWITSKNAGSIFKSAQESLGPVDVFSLDVDGIDFWIAKAVDFSQVQVIVVEYNPLFGARYPVSVPSDDGFNRGTKHATWLYYGASLRSWINFFKPLDFAFLGTNRACNNAFFGRIPLPEALGIRLPDIGKLDQYVDFRVRESRDSRGELSYLTGSLRWKSIEGMPLVDTETGQELFVGPDLF